MATVMEIDGRRYKVVRSADGFACRGCAFDSVARCMGMECPVLDCDDLEENVFHHLEPADDELTRVEADEKSVLSLYDRTINTYGIDAQMWMLVEECGELLNAISKLKRGRSTREEIITELADVHIMVEQMSFYFGWDEIKAEKKRKLERLQERLNGNEGSVGNEDNR